MKKAIFFLSSVFIFHCVSGQPSDSAWIVDNYTKLEQQITMRDGIKLFTSIYIPKDTTEAHPILMKRTPYSCAPYGTGKWGDVWNSYQKEYFKERYIMVTQDVRGRWMSEGEFVDVRPFNPNKKTSKDIDEASDTYDSIDWLIKNVSNNNGKVGVFGVSYPGFYSTMAAASGHPALLAVSPQAPVTNWFIGDDWHHNGAFFLMDAFNFYSALGGGFGGAHPRPDSLPPRHVGYPVHDNYKFYLEAGPLASIAKLLGDTMRFWKDLYAHPDYDDWWKARDARNATRSLKPAMLWVGGLFDAEDHWGAWNSYLAAEENNPGKEFNKIVMGPWSHGQWSGNDATHLGNVGFGNNTSPWYQQNIEIPFFNYFLKGKNGAPKIAEATIFLSGANKWMEFDKWPPTKQDKVLYLHGGEKLDWKQPSVSNSYSEYVSDPAKPVPYTEDVHLNRTATYITDDQRFAERRTDVLTFKTDILTKDLTVTGNVVANIIASISTTDADFVVKLIDVFPDSFSYHDAGKDPALNYPMGGYEMLVHGEIFRGRYRKSFEKPEPFVPGRPEKINFKVGDVAHTFLKGHRIMVQVQSSWFPLADMNPQKFVNIYKAKQNDFQKATIRVLHDAKNSSSIILPVLKD